MITKEDLMSDLLKLNNDVDLKQLQAMFSDSLIKVIRLKGYSSYNRFKGIDEIRAYSTAKQPIDKDYTNLSTPGVTQDNIEAWLSQGGWVGLVIPQGYIIVDVDDIEEAEQLNEALLSKRLKYHLIHTPNGMQFILKDTGNILKQAVNVITALGITVDYRLSGKGQIVLPSRNTEGREWVLVETDISSLLFFLEPINCNSCLIKYNV
jgi:Bifunctional DNA primase/polymerase, N-terminal.